MADQNKDETKPILSGLQPGPTEHWADTDEQLNTTPGGTGGYRQSTSSSAAGSTGDAGDTAKSAAQSMKESGAQFADEAKRYASDMTDLAKEKSRSLFQQQKETTVGQVDSVAHAFRNTAQSLHGEGQDQIGHYIEMAADKLESFGNQLRQKDLDTLIDDTKNLARRAPIAVFAGTVAVGFLLSRFLKSSAERRQQSMHMADEEWGASASGTGRQTYSGMPDTDSRASASAADTDIAGDAGSARAATEPLPSSLGGTDTGGTIHGNR